MVREICGLICGLVLMALGKAGGGGGGGVLEHEIQ